MGWVGAFAALGILACSGASTTAPPPHKPTRVEAKPSACELCKKTCGHQRTMCEQAVNKLVDYEYNPGDKAKAEARRGALGLCLGEGITNKVHACITAGKDRDAAWKCQHLGKPTMATACDRCRSAVEPSCGLQHPIAASAARLAKAMCACDGAKCASGVDKQRRDFIKEQLSYFDARTRALATPGLDQFKACQKRLYAKYSAEADQLIARESFDFAKQMCACKNLVCAKSVRDAAKAWIGTLPVGTLSNLSRRGYKQMSMAGRKLQRCFRRLQQKQNKPRTP